MQTHHAQYVENTFLVSTSTRKCGNSVLVKSIYSDTPTILSDKPEKLETG